jgi:hypothetical protein
VNVLAGEVDALTPAVKKAAAAVKLRRRVAQANGREPPDALFICCLVTRRAAR